MATAQSGVISKRAPVDAKVHQSASCHVAGVTFQLRWKDVDSYVITSWRDFVCLKYTFSASWQVI